MSELKNKSRFEFIRNRLKDLGKKQNDMAKYIGIEPSHLSVIINGTRLIKSNEVEPIAKFLEIDTKQFIKYIAGDTNDWASPYKDSIKSIYKIGYVQAGTWNEACQLPEEEWEELPVPANIKYNNIFALGVRGDSMDKIYPPEKTTLVCCPTENWLEKHKEEELNNKCIIAYRYNKDGLCEATVKRYNKIDDNTIILIAESSNPLITNIILHPDDNEYEIHAVVIGSYTDES